MASLVYNKKNNGIEVNINELILRLKALNKECDEEIIRIAISSMLEELMDAKSK